ncbi:hypothetical protein [Ferrimonas pelagia]|uniref:DUF218 domain-containing protein n=1 Tax=Ferrimonas pelagia TaxID=1177826 RepID=A0ABP9EEX7_9GAMM
MPRDALITQLSEHLSQQLGHTVDDPTLPAQLAELFYDAMLDWQAPELTQGKVGAIIACSFGYARQENGNIIAGPMNAQLADVVVALQQQHQCRVFAQWEIAEAIGNRIDHTQLTAIHPDIDPHDATVTYLSTTGVLNKVIKALSFEPPELGNVLMVAWRHHITRTVNAARQCGFHAWSAPLDTLPSDYDPASGQAWTRNPRDYLLHDVVARIPLLKEELSPRPIWYKAHD